jgi:tRNA (guanosine-2'-O-)-methyltransferase
MNKQRLIEKLREFLLPERAQRIHEVVQNRTRMIHVAIEDTTSERNAGAIFRTCDCFGIQGVSIIENRYDHKVTKIISKGSEKWLNVSKYNDQVGGNTSDCIANLKKQGYKIVATTPHDADVDLPNFSVSEKIALFFGTEETGLSEEALEQADIRLSIPIYGFTESYNISVSAALILQQLTAQIRRDGLNWQLSEEEQAELELEWIKKSIGRGAEKIINRVLSESNTA